MIGSSTRKSQGLARLRALPIALKLALILALVLVITGIITDIAVNRVIREGQQEVVLSDLQTLGRSNAFRMVDVLGQEITALNSLAVSQGLQDQLALLQVMEPETEVLALDGELSQEIRTFRQTHSELDAVALLDPTGHVRAIDPLPDDSVNPDPGNAVWFTGAYNNGEGATYLSSPDDDHLTGKTGIHIAIPIFSNTNEDEIIGVLYAVWNMSNILDITEVGAGREGLILEPDGTVLVSPSDERGTSYPRALATAFGEPSGSFIFTDNDGIEWLYGYVKLQDLGLGDQTVANLRWTVAVRQPTAAVEASVAGLANRLRLTIGLSALAVTLIVAIATSVLLRPLIALTRAAAALQEGDLTAPIPQLPADEVGRLADVMRALVDRLLSRLAELRAAVQVSHATTLTQSIEQMLSDVAQTLTRQFDYPDVRIYLTDPGARYAYIQAGSGNEADRLMRSNHTVEIDETTLVGRSIMLGEPQFGVGRSDHKEAGLASGRSELSIPLLSGTGVLGALHVLAMRRGTFEQEDVDILRLIADQLSVSITNAQLFEQSQANLSEIEALNRRLTRDAWDEYLNTTGAIRHTLDPEHRWPAALEPGVRGDDTKVELITEADGRMVMAVPIVLRGESVGSLAVTRPPGERWSRDEIALLEAVASRMSMIAEGIRLVDESNRRAIREQRVNEVSANLLARATSVESVLRNALNELGGSLGSERISLRIGPAPVDAERPSSGVIEYRTNDQTSPNGGERDDNGLRRSNGDGD